jgi:hypothetical protein
MTPRSIGGVIHRRKTVRMFYRRNTEIDPRVFGWGLRNPILGSISVFLL